MAGKLDEERRRLAADPGLIAVARGWARAMARSRGLARMADDLEGAALAGLVEAAASYDPGRGAAFRTHAFRRIRGAVLDELRRAAGGGIAGWAPRGRGVAPVVSLDAPMSGADPGRAAPAAAIADGSLPVGWEAEYEDEVEAMAARLPRRHGDTIRLLYQWADTAKMAGAAAFDGRTVSSVSAMHAQAVAMLRGDAPPPPPPGRQCRCGRPISHASATGRCAGCAQRDRAARERAAMRAEADARIAAVLGRSA